MPPKKAAGKKKESKNPENGGEMVYNVLGN
jgi:hypothetical protein